MDSYATLRPDHSAARAAHLRALAHDRSDQDGIDLNKLADLHEEASLLDPAFYGFPQARAAAKFYNRVHGIGS